MESVPMQSYMQDINELGPEENVEVGQGEIGQTGETVDIGKTVETGEIGETDQKVETDQIAETGRTGETNDTVEPSMSQGGERISLSREQESLHLIGTDEPLEQEPEEDQKIDVIESLGKVSTRESILVEDIVEEELLWVFIENHGNDILIFIRDGECNLSQEVLSILQDHAESSMEIEVVDVSEVITFAPDFPEALKEFTGNDCPLVFYKQKYVGNHSDIVKANHFKRVDLILEPPPCPCYHIVIIGTGPGALSVITEIERSDKSFKIALIDWTPLIPYNEGRVIGIGTQGNLPRKLLWNAIRNVQASQEASLLLRDEDLSGYNLSEVWDDATYSMYDNVDHVNCDFRKRIASIKIDFYRGSIEFIGPDTITVTYGIDPLDSSESSYSSSSSTTSTSTYNPSDEDYGEPRSTNIVGMNFIICGGTIPRIVEFPGFEHCVTIDNFLYEEEFPPTALIIGNTPEVFETAHLIASYGGAVTVMNKCTQWLSRYDQESIEKIINSFQDLGVRFIKISRIMYLKETDLGYKIKVKLENNRSYRSYFYTVLIDYTRVPLSSQINIEEAGVKLSPLTRKIIVDEEFRTANKSVWAFGSVARKHLGTPQFEIIAGKRVINLILNGLDDVPIPNIFPGVLLTPLEYGFVGETEKSATLKYKSQITIYESESHLAPYTETRVIQNPFQIKIICVSNWHCFHREKVERVLGIHFLGKNASRLITGFASSLEKGLTKRDFVEMVSIKASEDMGLLHTDFKLKDKSEKKIISPSTGIKNKNKFLRSHIPYRYSKQLPSTTPGRQKEKEIIDELPQADANRSVDAFPVDTIWRMELALANVNDEVDPDAISINMSDSSGSSLDPPDRKPSNMTTDTSFSTSREHCPSITCGGSFSIASSSKTKSSSTSFLSLFEGDESDIKNRLDDCLRIPPGICKGDSSSDTDSLVSSIFWLMMPFVLSSATEISEDSGELFKYISEPASGESVMYPGIKDSIHSDEEKNLLEFDVSSESTDSDDFLLHD